MTIREFYTVIGGNYDEVLGRLQHEELVRRFVKRFLTDRTPFSGRQEHFEPKL